MNRRRFICAAAASGCSPAIKSLAAASLTSDIILLYNNKKSYIGWIDIVANPGALYSLSAGSAAIAATGTQKAVNVRRNTDSALQDILILVGGDLDVASATTFAGTYTFTGTITGTVLTISAISGTPVTVGDTIVGTGVTANSYIVSDNTGSGGVGSYNLNVASTVSVGETITATHGLYVKTWYDQSTNGRDAVQATTTAQPQLFLSGGTSSIRPYVHFAGAQKLVATIPATNTPISMMGVAERTGNTSAYGQILCDNAAGSRIYFSSTPNKMGVYAGTTFEAAANDNAWHVITGVTGSSGALDIDGSRTTGNTGTVITGTSLIIGSDSGTQILTGNIAGTAWWPGISISAQNQIDLNSNAHTYGNF